MRPLAQALPGALAELLRDAPLSDGKVQFAWRATVGAAFDRATAVKLEDGVLIVETASRQWAREIHRSAPMILPRLRSLLGGEAVSRMEVRALDRTGPGHVASVPSVPSKSEL